LKKITSYNGSKGFSVGPADIHLVGNAADVHATSLHLYIKPFDSCAIYDLEKNEKKIVQLHPYSINGQKV